MRSLQIFKVICDRSHKFLIHWQFLIQNRFDDFWALWGCQLLLQGEQFVWLYCIASCQVDDPFPFCISLPNLLFSNFSLVGGPKLLKSPLNQLINISLNILESLKNFRLLTIPHLIVGQLYPKINYNPILLPLNHSTMAINHLTDLSNGALDVLIIGKSVILGMHLRMMTNTSSTELHHALTYLIIDLPFLQKLVMHSVGCNWQRTLILQTNIR